jgi:hypothetical protein
MKLGVTYGAESSHAGPKKHFWESGLSLFLGEKKRDLGIL